REEENIVSIPKCRNLLDDLPQRVLNVVEELEGETGVTRDAIIERVVQECDVLVMEIEEALNALAQMGWVFQEDGLEQRYRSAK
ncbi:MAG: hypothetical protein ABEI13_04200, partial [Candidatus Paceibacteria bacterium]